MSVKTRHGTCCCCGREVTSREEGYFFSWFCEGDIRKSPCQSYGKDDHCESCQLDSDVNLAAERERTWKFIRSKVFSIVADHGFCVTNNETEVLRALEEDIKQGHLKCYPIKEGGEMIALRFVV